MSQNTNVLYKTKTSEFYVNKLQLPHKNTFVKKKKNLLPKTHLKNYL